MRWRLGPESLPITWVAAAFALLVGATMVFVPYEFQTRLFRTRLPEHPHAGSRLPGCRSGAGVRFGLGPAGGGPLG